MSGEKAPKKQSFLQGVAVLTAATIIVKLLGFIYKVPLQNILQERGFGYFNTAYDVYNVLLMISTTGLPVAVSRMISQAQALENYAQIRKIYSVSMKVFLTIGVIGTLVMLVFCKPLSVMVTTNENSWAAIAALSPCVLLICIVSAHRGFFQGQSNMTPTSVSQVYEAMIRVAFGLGGAYLMLKTRQSRLCGCGRHLRRDGRLHRGGRVSAHSVRQVQPDPAAGRGRGQVYPPDDEGTARHCHPHYAGLSRTADHQSVRHDDLYAAADRRACVVVRRGGYGQGHL